MGVVSTFMASAAMMGNATVTPASSEVPAPGVKKTGGMDPRGQTPFCYCVAMKGAIGGEVAATYGPEVRRCGAASPAVTIAAALSVVAIRAVKPEDVPAGAVIMTCCSEIA